MSEDYTWDGGTAPSVARVRELEAQLNAAIVGAAELAQRVAELEESREFWRTASLDWKARFEAVPVEAIGLMLWGDSTSFGYVEACGMVGNWLVSVSELTPTVVEVQP